MDERLVGAGPHSARAIRRDHPPVDIRTVEGFGGCVAHQQQMLPVGMPDRMPGSAKILSHPLGLPPARWNYPDGTAPRHGSGDAPGADPVRHVRSVWRKAGIEAVPGHQPRVSSQRGHLEDAATLAGRPKHDPAAVGGEIGHLVVGAVERQTDGRTPGDLLHM